MMKAALVFSMLVALAQGFMLAPAVARSAARTALIKMDAAEVAARCLDEGCPIDLVSDLIDELKAESDELSKRQQTLLVAIGRLQALSSSPESNKNELEKLVGAASRSFTRVDTDAYDFPGEALGYTLKPSKGNTLD
jgi:6-phosphogluconate dehydrogenase